MGGVEGEEKGKMEEEKEGDEEEERRSWNIQQPAEEPASPTRERRNVHSYPWNLFGSMAEEKTFLLLLLEAYALGVMGKF